MYGDLHIHSNYSDGTNSPREIVRIAKQNNVSVIALADHDTLEGLSEFQNEAKLHNIDTIPAVEISTTIDGLRIHILGYYIDCENQKLKDYLSTMSNERTNKTKQMLKKLNELEMLNYAWERVEQYNQGKSWICSMHVFEAMRLDGCYDDRAQWKEFYKRYFSKYSPAYMSLEGFTAESAVKTILDSGGIPVIAHPKLIGDDRHIERLVKSGLMGIEVFYPAHEEKDIRKYINMAREHNLLVTGGTDWHGDYSEWKVSLGEFGIEKYQVEALKECSSNKSFKGINI